LKDFGFFLEELLKIMHGEISGKKKLSHLSRYLGGGEKKQLQRIIRFYEKTTKDLTIF